MPKNKSRQPYSEEDLKRALWLKTNTKTTLISISQQTNIPTRTISHKLHNKIDTIQKIGRKTLLSITEEEYLAEWARIMHERGIPMTKLLLRQKIQLLLQNQNKTGITFYYL
jgi:hypothetical protein